MSKFESAVDNQPASVLNADMTILRAPTRWQRPPRIDPADDRRLTRNEQDHVRRLAFALQARLGSRSALAMAMRTTTDALRKSTNADA